MGIGGGRGREVGGILGCAMEKLGFRLVSKMKRLSTQHACSSLLILRQHRSENVLERIGAFKIKGTPAVDIIILEGSILK
jgi:hypothetical protein